MTVSDLAIETRGLTKRYSSAEALAGVDLHVPTGTVYGFLGRNGAGKTTTIKTLMGMVRPSGGEGHILRHPIGDDRAGVEIRRRTAYVGEDRSLWPGMTVDQILRISRPFFPRCVFFVQMWVAPSWDHGGRLDLDEEAGPRQCGDADQRAGEAPPRAEAFPQALLHGVEVLLLVTDDVDINLDHVPGRRTTSRQR